MISQQIHYPNDNTSNNYSNLNNNFNNVGYNNMDDISIRDISAAMRPSHIRTNSLHN
jgi:hypothetical protein